MKLNTFLVKEVLSGWTPEKYIDGLNTYWASDRLVVASCFFSEELRIRFHVRGFAIATKYYAPDPNKLSVDSLNRFNLELAKTSAYCYTATLNGFVNATRLSARGSDEARLC